MSELLEEYSQRESMEWEADRLLRKAGFLKAVDPDGDEPQIYRECDFRRAFRPEVQADELSIQLAAERIAYDYPGVSLAEALPEARLTRQQRLAVKLMQRLENQANVGKVMKIKQSAVSLLLSRALERVREQASRMQAEIPSDDAERMFWAEIRYKRTIMYFKPVGGMKVNYQSEFKMQCFDEFMRLCMEAIARRHTER